MLSVVIHTKNSAETLARALESVKFAQEVIVVDMHSNDDTRQIARRYNAIVKLVDDVGYADPMRNWGIAQCSHEWILVVDADEEVPFELSEKIMSIVSASEGDVWQIPRQNLIFGKWIEHAGWWPDYQYHLFRKGYVKWTDKVHTHPRVEGDLRQLPALKKYAKIHHNYPDLMAFLKRSMRYSQLQAEAFPERYTRRSVAEVYMDEFLKRYIVLQGHEDGPVGTQLCALQAIHEGIASAWNWEKTGNKVQSNPLKVLSKLEAMIRYYRLGLKIEEAPFHWKWWYRLQRKWL